nr:hypothetical protein CFP56_48721 [Quercus suber]
MLYVSSSKMGPLTQFAEYKVASKVDRSSTRVSGHRTSGRVPKQPIEDAAAPRNYISSRLLPAATFPAQSQTRSDVLDIFTGPRSTVQTESAALDEIVRSGQKMSSSFRPKDQEATLFGSSSMQLKGLLEHTTKPPDLALHDTVRGLQERLATLENMLSFVRDDVDGSNQGYHAPSPAVSNSESGLPGVNLNESAPAQIPLHEMTTKGSVPRDSNVSQRRRKLWGSATLSNSRSSLPISWRVVNPRQSPAPELQPIRSLTPYDHRTMHERATNVSPGRSDLAATHDSLHRQIRDYEQQHHEKIADLYRRLEEMQRDYNTHNEQKQSRTPINNASVRSPVGPEEVTSRDNEVRPLHELLRNARGFFRRSEQRADKKDGEPSVLAAGCEQHNVQTDDVTSSTMKDQRTLLFPSQDELAVEEANVGDLQSAGTARHGVIEASSRGYRNVEREIHDCHSQRDDAVHQAERLTKMLRDAEVRERDLLRAHAEEIDRLRDLCKPRDDIADQQQVIVDQYTALLRQRDSELEEMTVQLRKAESDRDSEKAQHDTLTKLFTDTDEALRVTRSQVIDICKRPKTLTGFGTEVADLQDRLEDISSLVVDAVPSTGTSHSRGKSAHPLTVESENHGRADEVPNPGPAKNSSWQSVWSTQPIAGQKSSADVVGRSMTWASKYRPVVFGQPGIIVSSLQY